jgi:hypothetical protein
MSFTGVGSLDHSIDKCNAWLAGIEEGFGTLPGDLRELLEPARAEPPTGGKP